MSSWCLAKKISNIFDSPLKTIIFKPYFFRFSIKKYCILIYVKVYLYFNFVGGRIMPEKFIDYLTGRPRKIANLENTISNEANLFEHQSSEIQWLKDQNQILVEKIETFEKNYHNLKLLKTFSYRLRGYFWALKSPLRMKDWFLCIHRGLTFW